MSPFPAYLDIVAIKGVSESKMSLRSISDSAMKVVYFVVNGTIASKESMWLKGCPSDLLMVMFAMRIEDHSKVRPNPQALVIYDDRGNPIEPPIPEDIPYIFLTFETSIGIAMALIEEERYVPPPIMASLNICPFFKHMLIEVRSNHSETVHFGTLLNREILIVVDLLKVLTGQEEEMDMEVSLGAPVREAIVKMRGMSRLDNPLYRTFSVLNELRSYFAAATGTVLKKYFLSIIYYRDMPWMMITTTVLSDISFEQQRIVRLPSAWIYGIEHADNREMRNMSLLLHSITSYSMLQVFPRLRLLEIPSPYPIMATILREASKKYGFKIDEPGYRIDIVREVAWLNIWKQWIIPCNACCCEPAKWRCGSINRVLCEGCVNFRNEN